MTQTLSEALAAFCVHTSLADLGEAQAAHARDAFLNWIGCAIGGAKTSTVETAARAYRAIDPAGTDAVLGRDDRHSIIAAISLDCLSSATLAYDDTHLETVLHPTGPVAAALLGLARRQRLTGVDLIEALLIGMEVECRIGLAFASAGTGANGGWYATGLAGGIGAAAAVGKVLGFDEDRMLNAFGIAAARASGNRGTHGSMAGQYVPSIAAESGYIAARMAEAGFTCGSRALDGRGGLLELVAPAPAIARALRGLGAVSEAARTAFKPYPTGIITHPVIDACLALAAQHGVQADEISALHVAISPTAFALGSGKYPQDVFAAQVSIAFWAAVALVFGRIETWHTQERVLQDPTIAGLQAKISLSVSPDLSVGQCRAIATLNGAGSIEIEVANAVGSAERPMTRAEISAKFHALVTPASSPDRAQRLHHACTDILELDDVARILIL